MSSPSTTPPVRLRRPRRPVPAVPVADVTAVLVAHDGAAWLPEVLTALRASTLRPRHLVCVDTGSTDGSPALLRAAGSVVLELSCDTGFGAAVAAGLDSVGDSAGWVWLLHDDCAVEPDTLQALLGEAERSPSAAVLGPKVRDWTDPRVLVEVGLTTDGAGHRETGLDRREYDQGQHDSVRDVLAVGTAGALVRRQVWDAVGGLDRSLPVFRDDLDLGWRVNAAGHRVLIVPAARVRHVRAATTGRRQTQAAPGRATATDRRHALFVLLAHAGLALFVTLLPRLLIVTLVRALVLLLTRQLPAAVDELRAYAGVVGHPRTLLRARQARARTRTVSTRSLRPLFASRTGRARARAGVLGDWLSGGASPGAQPLLALGDPGPDGPDPVELTGGGGTLRRLLLRPGVLLTLALALVALVAERHVLSLGGGVLSGGQLLPAPDGARDLWAAYAASWHPTTVGTSAVAPPALAVLAALSTVLLGKPWLAVDVLLLASLPLAGATAYAAARRVVRHQVLRLWAAATWALLPVATGAIAAGRLDAAVVQIALPLLLLGGARVLREDPAEVGWRHAWTLGLGLSLVTALAPALWPVAAVTLLAGGLAGLLRARSRLSARQAVAALIAAVTPIALLLPWSLSVLGHPALLTAPVRRAPGTVDVALPAWHLPLLAPGGPGLPATLLTTGLLLAALAGLVRQERRQLARTAWSVADVALLGALLLARQRVPAAGTATAAPLWPGVPLQLAGAAMLLAALVAADGVRTRLARAAFGWRQLLAWTVAVAAAAVPVVAAATWLVRAADDTRRSGAATTDAATQEHLHRGASMLLPAFAQAELAATAGLRALVLAPTTPGAVSYELTGDRGDRLDAGGTPPAAGQTRRLDEVVADLLVPRGSDAAEALSTRAVRYVVLHPGPGAAAVAAGLDAQPGLVRRASTPVLLWQVLAPTARLSVLPPAAAASALLGARGPSRALLRTAPASPLRAGVEGAADQVPSGPDGRLLVLADAEDAGWRATLDGRPLPRRTAWGWAQAFALPVGGGRIEVHHEQGRRHAWLEVEGALLLLVAVLAAPGRAPRSGLEGDDGRGAQRTQPVRAQPARAGAR